MHNLQFDYTSDNWIVVFKETLEKADDDKTTDLLFDTFNDLLLAGKVGEAETLLFEVRRLDLNANVTEAARIVGNWVARKKQETWARRVL